MVHPMMSIKPALGTVIFEAPAVSGWFWYLALIYKAFDKDNTAVKFQSPTCSLDQCSAGSSLVGSGPL